MNQSISDLLANIEECREEMICTAENSSMVDNQVVNLSKQLDELLNQYYKLYIEKQ